MHWITREYFALSVREKSSFLIVLILLYISILVRILISDRESGQLELSEEQINQVHSFVASFVEETNVLQETEKVVSAHEATEISYQSFNPNTIEKEKLIKMGLNEFVINNIIRYRDAGGVFKKPEDLSKIYGMSFEDYERLEPFIIVPSEEDKPDTLTKNSQSEQKFVHDANLNSAQIKDFMILQGMTPGIAGRIIRYRELLGGFFSFDQLAEVYEITDSLQHLISVKFFINQSDIRKISLQKGEFKEFLKHPYLEKSDVKELFRLKDYYSDSISFRYLIQNKWLPDSILQRIIPYFEE